MPRYERSAGVVTCYERTGKRSYLLLDYGKHWDFPKGHVEKGEDDQAAAIRELAEETGINVASLVEGFKQEITYFFRDYKTKSLIRKTVVFFLAVVRTKKVQLSQEHVGYEFLEYEQAIKRVKFPTAKKVLRAAETFLNERRDAEREMI